MGAPAQIVQGQPEDVPHLARIEQIAVVPLVLLAGIGPLRFKNPRVKVDVAGQGLGAVGREKGVPGAGVVRAQAEVGEALAGLLPIDERVVNPVRGPQIDLPPQAPFKGRAARFSKLLMHLNDPVRIEVAVEPEEGIGRPRAIDERAALFLDPQADVVANGHDLDFSERAVELVLIHDEANELDHLPAIVGGHPRICLAGRHGLAAAAGGGGIGIAGELRRGKVRPAASVAELLHRTGGILHGRLKAKTDVAIQVGFGRAIDGCEAIHVLQGRDVGTGRGKDAELAEGLGPLFVREVDANLFDQDRTAQVDLHDPLVERVGPGWLPKGRGVPVDDPGGVAWVAQRRPDAAGHLPALIRRVGEQMGVERGVDVLAELDQPQVPLRRKDM